MVDQQIESISNKLVEFIQDLTANIQTIFNTNNFSENFVELFQLRSDYAKQLASLCDILINRFIEEFLLNQTNSISLKLDPVQIWRSQQCCIDQLNDMSWQRLCFIIKHLRTINHYFYNLLLQLKNGKHLQIDLTHTLNQNLFEELNCLSNSLMTFTTTFCNDYQVNDNTKLQSSSIPSNTYLFQSVSPIQNSNKNTYINEGMSNIATLEKSNNSQAINSNCYPYTVTRNPCATQQSDVSKIRQGASIQPNLMRCPTEIIPTTGGFSYCKPMHYGTNATKSDKPPPLCFSTPIIYSPEIENLFSTGGIIYARKSGNAWIAENLGSLIETIEDVGKNMDMDEHHEILIRKTGELVTHRKTGHRKRLLQQTLNKNKTSLNNNAHESMNISKQCFESLSINDLK